MRRRRGGGAWLAVALGVSAALGSGCAQPPVAREPVVAAPRSPAHVEAVPRDAVLPLGAGHLLLVTVRDDAGRPVPGAPVSWVVVAGSVGGIVAVDSPDRRPARVATALPEAATTTTAVPYELAFEGAVVPVGVGQTWCVVAADREGDGEVLAYAPGNPDPLWGEVRFVRTWVDAAWEWPPDATSAAGTPHTLATLVRRASNDEPLAGQVVTYEVTAGEAGASFAGGRARVEVLTDDSGVAAATLRQAVARAGACEVRVTLRAPRGEDGAEGRVLATHVARKTWTAAAGGDVP